MEYIMVKPSAVHFLSICYVLKFSLNRFFMLIEFDKKGNAAPMQTRVIFFWPGEANCIIHIAKHVYIR